MKKTAPKFESCKVLRRYRDGDASRDSGRHPPHGALSGGPNYALGPDALRKSAVTPPCSLLRERIAIMHTAQMHVFKAARRADVQVQRGQPRTRAELRFARSGGSSLGQTLSPKRGLQRRDPSLNELPPKEPCGIANAKGIIWASRSRVAETRTYGWRARWTLTYWS